MPAFTNDQYDPAVETEFPQPTAFDGELEIIADPADNKPAPTVKKITGSKDGFEYAKVELWARVIKTATGQEEVTARNLPGKMAKIAGMKIRHDLFITGKPEYRDSTSRGIKQFNESTGLNAASFQTDPNPNGTEDIFDCTISSWVGARFKAHLAPDKDTGYLRIKRFLPRS